MSILTPFFNLIKPAKTDKYKVSDFNANFDTIDTEMHKPPLTVNGIAPDPTTRDLTLSEVPLAGNLSSDEADVVIGSFIQRTSGGGASISDGQAFLTAIKGNAIHSGYVPQSIEWQINSESASATFDEATFVAYVETSGTITLSYTTEWSADPALYGFTVTGTPENGDTIVVVYVKENRGTITVTTPTAFNSTGWNLFNLTAGYAKVVRYSDTYGYRIGGNYSVVEFATTVGGTRSAVSMSDGLFNVPSDGFVFVTGGDATTYIYPTWSDWTEGYDGDFESYSLDAIDMTEVMLNFPNGLFAVGAVRDEINLNTQTAIHRVERLAYNSTNLAAVIASGVDYDADTNYIYAVLETPTTAAIDLDGEYTVDDHGIEYYSGTSVPVVTESLYGENLKDKLRTDVLTISAQELSAAQIEQVQQNIGNRYFRIRPSMYNKTLSDLIADVSSLDTGEYLYFCGSSIVNSLAGSNSASGTLIVTKINATSVNYIVSNGYVMGCGLLNISAGTATIKYTTANAKVTNESSTLPDKTVATDTDTTFGYIDLTPGNYLIIFTVNYAANATGYRTAWVSDTDGGGQTNMAARTVVAPANGLNTRFQLPIVTSVNSNTRLYLVTRQTSGSSLAANARYSLMRIS